MNQLQATFTAIDDANDGDPNDHLGTPLALFQGQAASRWLSQIDPGASAELQLAARAHHLRRWELARADYPAGRQGYLRWRRENKAHQADSLAAIMDAHDWSIESVARARHLLGRTKLRTDIDTQSLEDAACLVFLETQFDSMTERTEHQHMVSIVAKTLTKMSSTAVSLASSIDLSEQSRIVLTDAVTSLENEEQHD